MAGTPEDVLQRELARERKARRQAEQLLEQKSLELYERNQALQESNEELERFAYVASHDLQTPLRSIVSFSQLLGRRVRQAGDAKSEEYLGFIESSARRLHEVIRDLLEYSRAGRRAHAPERFSAQGLVGEVCGSLRAAVEAAGAEVVFDGLPEVYGDRSQLVHVVQNLIANGLKFQPKDRRPRVEVRIEAGDDGGWHWQVRDNGIGIEPHQIPRLFTLFTRLHSNDQYEGTGVGLAICKRIVEKHGGRIWIESAPGEGATFHFTLGGPPSPEGPAAVS